MNIKQSLLLVTLFACSLSANEQFEKTIEELRKDQYREIMQTTDQVSGTRYRKLEKPAKFLRYIPVGKDVVMVSESSTGETKIEKEERIYDYSYIGPYILMIGGVLAIIRAKSRK